MNTCGGIGRPYGAGVELCAFPRAVPWAILDVPLRGQMPFLSRVVRGILIKHKRMIGRGERRSVRGLGGFGGRWERWRAGVAFWRVSSRCAGVSELASQRVRSCSRGHSAQARWVIWGRSSLVVILSRPRVMGRSKRELAGSAEVSDWVHEEPAAKADRRVWVDSVA